MPVNDVTRAYAAVMAVVHDAGLLRRAQWFYALVLGGNALALGGVVTGMVLLGDSWFQLLMAGALGLILTQFAFVAHEASHRQVLASGPANDALGKFLGNFIVGMSYSWWMTKHSRHHANPNQVGKDPDIDVDTISFTVESAAKARGVQRWITQRQGYLFFPLLMGEGLNLHTKSFTSLMRRGKIRGRGYELTLLSLRFAIYLSVLFLIFPLGLAFAFLGVQLAVFGVYMGASFAPNHKGMRLLPSETRMDFFSKQVLTSRNIKGGWWATGLYGGLNLQVEHHLFPSMPRPHLSKAREIVREYCDTLKVPYTETTMLESYGIVIRYLNEVGLAARDPFDCPPAAQWRRP